MVSLTKQAYIYFLTTYVVVAVTSANPVARPGATYVRIRHIKVGANHAPGIHHHHYYHYHYQKGANSPPVSPSEAPPYGHQYHSNIHGSPPSSSFQQFNHLQGNLYEGEYHTLPSNLGDYKSDYQSSADFKDDYHPSNDYLPSSNNSSTNYNENQYSSLMNNYNGEYHPLPIPSNNPQSISNDYNLSSSNFNPSSSNT